MHHFHSHTHTHIHEMWNDLFKFVYRNSRLISWLTTECRLFFQLFGRLACFPAKEKLPCLIKAISANAERCIIRDAISEVRLFCQFDAHLFAADKHDVRQHRQYQQLTTENRIQSVRPLSANRCAQITVHCRCRHLFTHSFCLQAKKIQNRPNQNEFVVTMPQIDERKCCDACE